MHELTGTANQFLEDHAPTLLDTSEAMTSDIRNLIHVSHTIAKKKGFWDAERNKGEQIALMHSELSELLEGIRKPGPDEHCPGFTKEEVELADLLIRAFDYAAGYKLRLLEAMFTKMRFNMQRPHKHGKKF